MVRALNDRALDMKAIQLENSFSIPGWFDIPKHLLIHHIMVRFSLLLIHFNEIMEFLNLKVLIVLESEKYMNQIKYTSKDLSFESTLIVIITGKQSALLVIF
jgi:hypothetical protein